MLLSCASNRVNLGSFSFYWLRNYCHTSRVSSGGLSRSNSHDVYRALSLMVANLCGMCQGRILWSSSPLVLLLQSKWHFRHPTEIHEPVLCPFCFFACVGEFSAILCMKVWFDKLKCRDATLQRYCGFELPGRSWTRRKSIRAAQTSCNPSYHFLSWDTLAHLGRIRLQIHPRRQYLL